MHYKSSFHVTYRIDTTWNANLYLRHSRFTHVVISYLPTRIVVPTYTVILCVYIYIQIIIGVYTYASNRVFQKPQSVVNHHNIILGTYNQARFSAKQTNQSVGALINVFYTQVVNIY